MTHSMLHTSNTKSETEHGRILEHCTTLGLEPLCLLRVVGPRGWLFVAILRQSGSGGPGDQGVGQRCWCGGG